MPTAERIAVVCPRFAEGGTVGGAETLLKNLALHAQSAGRKVTFLTTCAKNHFTWKNELPAGCKPFGGMDVHYFPVNEDRDVESFLRVQEQNCRNGSYTPEDELVWLRNSVNSRALIEYLRAHGADYDRIIVGPYLFGITWEVCQVYPEKTFLVSCLHDEGFARVRAIGDMFRRVGGILFNSEPERELADRLYGLKIDRCHVVGMGIESFDVSPTAFAPRHGMTAPYVIYSGRREDGKGLPLLLDYLTLFRARTGRDLKVVLTGSGEMHPPAALRPHIVDVGFVSEDEKREAMAGAVAFCHPSVNESFSIVLLEAWMARTPGMVHAKCAVTTYHSRQSNAGLWFRVYPEFEESLLMLLDNPELRKAMGDAGRRYVLREYGWSTIERKLFAALDAGPIGSKTTA